MDVQQFRSLHATRLGVPVALVSAASFGTSGALGKSLFPSGWSPTAAVTARIAIGAAALLVPTLLALRGRWHLVRHNARAVVLYGMAGVAGCQLSYFLAVQRLSVGVALLLEYLAPILLVLLAWARTGRRPSGMTAAGAVVAVAGLVLVLNVLGGVKLDPLGVVFGLTAAACLAVYFLVAAQSDDDALPPIALTGLGMGIGAIFLLVIGLSGLLPLNASTDTVELAGASVSPLVPLLGMGVIAGAVAYVTGVAAARLLGSRIASFVGLAEVLFAILFAWLLLGESLRPAQFVGGALIVGGVVLVRLAERRDAPTAAPQDTEPAPAY